MTPKGKKNYRLHPLDLELIRRMPREGSSLGWHTLAMTVKYATAELNKSQPREAPKLTADQVSGRLRAMEVAGYAVIVPTLGNSNGNGWQRTVAAEAMYEQATGKKLGDAPTALALVEGGQS